MTDSQRLTFTRWFQTVSSAALAAIAIWVGSQIRELTVAVQRLSEQVAIVTTDAMVAEGALSYLKEQGLRIPIITFDSVKPKIDIEAYVDINALELGRESFRTLLQIISDDKDGKQVCYRHVIPHKITKLK